jgi:NAD(P)-dependent dehydrogenase (short-subunit alcohol dehydrogenase family)
VLPEVAAFLTCACGAAADVQKRRLRGYSRGVNMFERAVSTVRGRLRAIDRTMTFRDRHVFVTGGSRGLGLQLAREFGARGARVTIAARDAAEVERARADLALRGIAAHGVAADVRLQPDVERAVAEATERFGPIDVLVNDAGIIAVAPLDAVTADDYRDALATHFWGPLYAVDAVLPSMRSRGAGRIVNIASIGGRVSVPHLLPYSASKFALVGWSEGLRAELVRERVYVTTVVPGLMRTGSPENASFKGRNRLEYAWFSIADSLPFLSVDVTRAAKEIADATARGDAELTISVPAVGGWGGARRPPALVTEVMGVVARVLPRNGGIGRASRRGRDSHSPVSPSAVTTATQHRAATQNEVS